MKYLLLLLFLFLLFVSPVVAEDIYYHPPANNPWTLHVHGIAGVVHLYIAPDAAPVPVPAPPLQPPKPPTPIAPPKPLPHTGVQLEESHEEIIHQESVPPFQQLTEAQKLDLIRRIVRK